MCISFEVLYFLELPGLCLTRLSVLFVLSRETLNLTPYTFSDWLDILYLFFSLFLKTVVSYSSRWLEGSLLIIFVGEFRRCLPGLPFPVYFFADVFKVFSLMNLVLVREEGWSVKSLRLR